MGAARKRKLVACVVGAGFTGIGTGYILDDMGIEYEIIEKNPDVGGTWYDNIYPGIGCDVMSHLYSLSQLPNPSWSESFSKGPEILAYLQRIAEPIRHKIQFNTKVVKTTWKEDISKWTIELNTGRVFDVDLLISGTGLLHKPKTVDFPGATDFEGISFHTNTWRKDVSLSGKRVAVIGTGATGVQVIPSIANMGVENLTVFQRTPCWPAPRFNYKYSDNAKKVFRLVPFVHLIYRWLLFCKYEMRFFIMFMLPSLDIPIVGKLHSRLQDGIHRLVRGHINKTIKDPDLAKKLTPDYPMGCKRNTPSDSYLQAFNKGNVHLEVDGIAKFNKEGIETKSGNVHKFDVIIYATGFDVIGSVNAFEIHGLGEKTLEEDHADVPRGYYGVSHHLCPNFFMLGGPGIVLGHNSVIFIGECQMTYIRSGIEELLKREASSVRLRESSMDEYQEWARNKMKNKVFEGTKFCTGWYRNSRGINWTFWPTNLISFWWYTMSFDSQNYIFSY